MQTNEIQQEIGKVVQNFAFIEWLIQNFVTYYYFKSTENKFKIDVLGDENFSFFLLKKIFLKLLKSDYPEQYRLFPKKDLNRMNELRNIFVHSKTAADGRGLEEAIKNGVYLERSDQRYQVEKIVEEYDQLKNRVQSALSRLPGVKFEVIK